MIRAFTENNDWIVEQDGRRVERFSEVRFGPDAAFFAARLANKLRRA